MAWSTDKPPKKRGRYLISVSEQVYIADRNEYPKDNWYWDTIFMGIKHDNEVQGWQKLPQGIKHG